ncbi:MAG TPA: hypothetical protein ENF24_01070 [Methanosarcinales archaeon]|nr:hypothetical protein [Methanosarcinales archaeon]
MSMAGDIHLMERKHPVQALILILILWAACICTFTSDASAAPVSVQLPAVYETSEGEVGVLANLTVWTENGTGHVFVDTAPFTQVDMQGSARLSSMVACEITGIDPATRDFFYVLHTETPVIGGPSAGAATTAATVAALMNWTVDPGVVMTGMINPDGSVGAVGGIPAKLNASAMGGAHTFLIPPGQGNVTVVERTIVHKGLFVTISEEPITIDVINLGARQGVEVVEIEEIRDAIFVYTGHKIPLILLTGDVQTHTYVQAMQPLALALLGDSRARYNDTDAIIAPIADSQFESALNRQSQAIDDAQSDYDAGNYYASMSRSFNTMIALRRIGWHAEYLTSDDRGGDRDRYLRGLVECTIEEIEEAELDIADAKSKNGILEGIGAAESRLTIARGGLEDARRMRSADDAIDLLAFAMERARSARWWATLSCIGGSGTATSDDLLRDRAGRYYSQSASILAYASALIYETGSGGGGRGSGRGSSSLLTAAADDLARARIELHTGYYAGAIYDSLHAMVYAGTAIELIGVDDLAEKANKSERDAMSAIISARECGAEPILAASAYEHAKTLAPSDIDRIIDYGYSRMVARTARSFACHGNGTNVSEVNASEISESIRRIVETPANGDQNGQLDPSKPPAHSTRGGAEMCHLHGVWVLAVVVLAYFIMQRRV